MDDIRRLIVLGLPLALPVMARASPEGVGSGAQGPQPLAINGTVRSAQALFAGSLRASPLATDVEAIPLTTRTGEIKRTLSGYRGIKLTDLLDLAQIDAPDHNALKRSYVVVGATDGYTVVFSWSELYNTDIGPGVLVLVEKEGQPLADTEGPLALISRKDIHTGPRHVRWLSSIAVQRA